MIYNLTIIVNGFTVRMLRLNSVDEILLSRYLKCSTNFRGKPLKMERVPFCL